MLDGGRLAVIETAAVLGAGVMGAGIAAHLANAGVSVILLDLAEDGPRRSRRAEQAIEGQIASGGFMTPALAARVTPGNIDDDLGLVAGADWIIEAVAEQLDVKRPLFAKLEALRKDGSIVSSNTSTLPLASLIAGPAGALRPRLPDHPFLQSTPAHAPAGAGDRPRDAAGRRRCDRRVCGFRAGQGRGRMQGPAGLHCQPDRLLLAGGSRGRSARAGLTVEEADAVISRPFGLPGTGIFGLLDLVGLDLMPQVWGSLARTLPADDPIRNYDLDPPLIRAMIGRGLTGRKAGGGFYRTVTSDGVKRRQAFDLASGEYRDLQPPALDSLGGLAGTCGRCCRTPIGVGYMPSRVMGATLAYAARAGARDR